MTKLTKLDLSFCEDLVYSDFFLVINNKNANSRMLENIVYRTKKDKLFTLDILTLYIELKKLIRLLEYLSLKAKKKDKLIISAKTSEDIFLLIAYLKRYFPFYNILISELNKVEDIQKFDSLKIGLISFFSYSEKLEKNLNLNNIFLISIIDLDGNMRKNASIYKIYNKLDSFKKSLFFIALLENVLSFHN